MLNKSKIKTISFFENKDILKIKKLKIQGLCNTNYKITTKNKSYILRVFKSNKSVNISREFEYQVQKKAFLKNISPKAYFFDIKNGFLISKYIKGKHKDTLSKKDLKALIKSIKKIHNLNMNSKVYDFYKDLDYYSNKLKDEKSKKALKKLRKELLKLSTLKKELALCHHDLNTKNIIFSKKNRIKIIDWEYAGVNDIFFDLATICVEYNLSKKKERLLLKYYFNKNTQSKYQKLLSYKKVYKLLCFLWFRNNL
ncbi:choline/ethanolamine kinase family protein [Arcobacter sp. CECT 8986]|uniref:choline/ethanolamine kinase family protein n=1 Tax=Arcobacter sp. CECT 8986 TaxID=2044507 RepID=UPI0013E961C7|nr:choline/ethanolamine kinase family protein [Arcobacter sp. CECT 8986]